MIKSLMDKSMEGEYMEYKDRSITEETTGTSPVRKGQEKGASKMERSEGQETI